MSKTILFASETNVYLSVGLNIHSNFSKFSINFHRTYDRRVVDIDITMAFDISIWCGFSQLKLNETNENPFWASCGKILPLVLNSP